MDDDDEWSKVEINQLTAYGHPIELTNWLQVNLLTEIY